MEGKLICEVEFEADTDADGELDAAPRPVLSDTEISGSRFILRQLDFDTNEDNGKVSTATMFTAQFVPGEGAWFSSVYVRFDFLQPSDANILALTPQTGSPINKRDIQIRKNVEGKLTFDTVSAGRSAEHTESFSVTPEIMSARGQGTAAAIWTLRSPSEHEPIPGEATLAILIEGEGPSGVELDASARLHRKGVAGGALRLRDLVIGPGTRTLEKKRFSFPLITDFEKRNFFSWLN